MSLDVQIRWIINKHQENAIHVYVTIIYEISFETPMQKYQPTEKDI